MARLTLENNQNSNEYMDPKSFIENHKDRLLNELFELLRIPSISADPAYNDDVAKCAAAIEGHISALGLENVEVFPTAGHPIVYGDAWTLPYQQC